MRDQDYAPSAFILTRSFDFRDKTFDDVIETISAMNAVVDRLYQSAQKLT